MHRCLWTAAIVTLAVLVIAGALAAVSGDARILRPPVFMAVVALAGGAGAFAGGWRGLAVAGETAKPGLLLCAAAIASSAWTIGYLHVPSDDYRLYELAARQWVAGESLYSAEGHNQLPTSLVLLGSLHLAVAWLGQGAGSDLLWRLTYYIYDVGQLLSLIAIVAGLYALGQAAGATRERAAVLAGMTVVLALPVKESIGNNQLNLPVLALALPALTGAVRHPVLAGVCAGLGGALKLYPLALLLEWLVARRWRALASAAITLAVVVLVLWPNWVDFAAFVRRAGMADAYRHVGLHAVVMNTSRDVATALGYAWRPLASGVWLATIVAVAWFAVRLIVRESRRPAAERRMLEASARVLASVLLVFPLAWAHHYVFAVPLAVCLWARGWPRPRYVAGTALVLFVPAFDIYPLGLHRLVGLVLLLVP